MALRGSQEVVLDKMRDGQFLMDFDSQRQQLLADLREASSSFVYGYDKRTEALQYVHSGSFYSPSIA
jgi:hypothetical protein